MRGVIRGWKAGHPSAVKNVCEMTQAARDQLDEVPNHYNTTMNVQADQLHSARTCVLDGLVKESFDANSLFRKRDLSYLPENGASLVQAP